MAEVIRMPKMSDTMEEGVIANWNVKVGDKVASGDILAEVETDKATMDMESYYEGTILHIGVEKGDAVPIDGIMAIIGEPGEDYTSLISETKETKVEEVPQPAAQAEAPTMVETPKVATSNINAVLVKMPLLSDTMTEGVIHTWLKKVGDKVVSGDALAEIETDKATMELEAYDEGTLLYIGVKEGESIAVNGVIAVIGEDGADYKSLLLADSDTPDQEKTSEVVVTHHEMKHVPVIETEVTTESLAISSSGDRLKASPLAKKIANDKGIDISQVPGSGVGGRIIKTDIDNFVPSAKPISQKMEAVVSAPSPIFGEESFVEEKLSQMRKAIARGFSNELPPPEFYVTMEINMDKAIEARTVMNASSPVKISFNDFIIKAVAVSLTKHPNVNASWRGDHIKKNSHIHIGMAVAIEDGLLMPVIRFANTLPLSVLATVTKDLGGKAKNKQLQPKDWEGNTFTVSNLGAFGVESFTSIINNRNNESCILAVGGIKETVAVKDGNFYATNVMKVTLTCDHRVVDGATGAAFLVTLKEMLEEPYRLLI